jgi:methylenetetrahydrofolate dehydrogenase (NADP+)/methenyltetrahydrofolate cyclohydrolase
MSEAKIIDGKAFAADLRGRVGEAVAALKRNHDLTPGLAVVLVGENPASQVYVRNKTKHTLEAGMNSFEETLSAETSQEELLTVVRQLNDDAKVHGILVQLPLPGQIDDQAVINTIDPDKDVDGFHVINAGRLMTVAKGSRPPLVPCTPLGCLMMLKAELGDLSGQHAVVVGRSNIVGKPMAQLLLQESCTVTIAHSRTRDLPAVCRAADILVAAVGRARMVEGDWIKPGAVVIDVGINRIEVGGGKTRLVGDVDTEAAKQFASAITPVPGGVGPMTIACLLANTVTAACRQHGITPPVF